MAGACVCRLQRLQADAGSDSLLFSIGYRWGISIDRLFSTTSLKRIQEHSGPSPPVFPLQVIHYEINVLPFIRLSTGINMPVCRHNFHLHTCTTLPYFTGTAKCTQTCLHQQYSFIATTSARFQPGLT